MYSKALIEKIENKVSVRASAGRGIREVVADQICTSTASRVHALEILALKPYDPMSA